MDEGCKPRKMPQGSMDRTRDFVFEKLGEVFSWVKSQLEGFFNLLSKKINESVDSGRRFFDNFSEKFKQDLIASKNFIEAAIQKIVKIMCSIGRLISSLISSSVHTAKEKISTLLVKLVSVLFQKLKNLHGYIKSTFSDFMKQTEEKTRQRFKSSTNFNDDKTSDWLYHILKSAFFVLLKILPHKPPGFFELLKILRHKPGRLVVILREAFWLITGMNSGECSEDLPEEERKASFFVFSMLRNLVESMIATRLKFL